MPAHVFDPTKPAFNSPRSSAEMLNQLLALSSVYMEANGDVRVSPFKWLHYDGPNSAHTSLAHTDDNAIQGSPVGNGTHYVYARINVSTSGNATGPFLEVTQQLDTEIQSQPGSIPTIRHLLAIIEVANFGQGNQSIAVTRFRAGDKHTYTPGSSALTPVMEEEPSGTKDGQNRTFYIALLPANAKTALYMNGLRLHQGVDFFLSGTTITLATGVPAPVSEDILIADYFV